MSGTGLLHEAVAEQAAARPDAVALIDGDLRVDYRTLDAAAEAYALELLRLGVGPGDLVPVLLPRSARFAAAVLAVLKCGAGYAALDRRWPPERIRGAVRTLNAPVALTDDAFGADLGVPGWTPPQAVLDAARSGAVPGSRVRVPVGDDAVAMVFFTSGTTGEPKGVLSPHRATTRLLRPGTFADFGPGRVMPLAAPVPWDAFSMELWGSLATGGTAVVVREDMLFPDDLRDLVADAGVDTMWLTASLFNLFVEEDPGCFTGMRQVLTGGERLSPPHVGEFLTNHPEITLTNGYGPVESCVFVTTRAVRPEDCDLPGGVPIGVPVPGTGIRLLRGDESVPDGTSGEICVSGEGLAAGYLARPEATAAAFVTVEVDGVPERLYRTGDLGVRDADGVLHFLGRADRQIKIFGHRVEPAEIESAAARVPGVRAARVVPVPGADGAYERLALFCTAPGDGPAPDPELVRKTLAQALPHYMVPASVRLVDAFPTTANGKLDQAALLAALAATGR
ncbi:amino acid adenylation domain-containing protein [Streptomyces griseoluteus]|uniref:amino acid adenylation domain-containing protein n=1 Tax=Streptomyces griseoluteus TaxID=29306 RepID=UPI0036FFE3CC